jgi:DNA-binding response OmpR family regulator
MKHKVMVVDDNADIRKMLRLALDTEFDVSEAQDAVTAWTMIRFDPPHAAVLDVMMPGCMNGLQLCEQIKSDPAFQSMYVVMATACGRPADEAYALAVGANAYYVKPFSPLALRMELTRMLGASNAAQPVTDTPWQ